MYNHVVIVGSGISGLYAAYKYVNDNYNVILIEKNSRLGGRIHTIQYHTNKTYEAGAGRFNKNHKILMKLINIFGLTTGTISKETEFRNTENVNAIDTDRINHSKTMLRKVIKHSKNIPKDILISLRFIQLCEMIIGKSKTHALINEFGYDAEFYNMNAYEAIQEFKKDFIVSKTYYYCKEGLSELVQRIETMLLSTGRVKIYKECEAVSVKYNKQYQYMKITCNIAMGDTRIFKSNIVLLALPKDELQRIVEYSIDDTQRKNNAMALLDSVDSIPLHRIYGKFTRTWFDGIPRTTTNDIIRQFIPINPTNALAMISYTDTKNAEYWHTLNEKELRSTLLKHLHIVFPEVKIPKLQWIHSHYWETGVHVWKSGANSEVIRPKVQRLFDEDIPVFVIGEAYSKHQSWIEGALESVEDIYQDTLKYIKNSTGGDVGINILKIDRNHLESKLAEHGITEYVKLNVNEKTRILDLKKIAKAFKLDIKKSNRTDITEYIKVHPDFYKDNPMYKQLNPYIMNVINKATVAFVI